MNKLSVLLLVTIIAIVSAINEDNLEETAKSVISKIQGEFGGHNRLNAFLDKTQVSTPAKSQLNSNQDILVAEGIGSLGATTVVVARGRRRVQVSTVYGLGAGVLANVSIRHHNSFNANEDQMMKQKLNDIQKPFYDKYVKSIAERKADDQTVVVVEGLRGQENVWLADGTQVNVPSISGFVLGAVTSVSRSDDLKATAENVLSNIGAKFGGKSGRNSLKADDFLNNFDTNSANGSKVEGYYGEGVGALGVLSILVKNKQNELNITTAYGLEAGSLSGYRAERNITFGDHNKEKEIKDMTQSLYDKYVKSIAEKKSSEGVLFVAGAEGKGEALVATREGYIASGTLGGFKLGALTSISTK